MAVSFQCMTKFTTIKKKKERPKKKKEKGRLQNSILNIISIMLKRKLQGNKWVEKYVTKC